MYEFLLSSVPLSLGFNSKDMMMRYIKDVYEQVRKRWCEHLQPYNWAWVLIMKSLTNGPRRRPHSSRIFNVVLYVVLQS